MLTEMLTKKDIKNRPRSEMLRGLCCVLFVFKKLKPCFVVDYRAIMLLNFIPHFVVVFFIVGVHAVNALREVFDSNGAFCDSG